MILILLGAVIFTENLNAQPQSLRPDITVSEVLELPSNTVRIVIDRSDSTIYIINTNGKIYSVDLEGGTSTQVYSSSNHGITDVRGFAISGEGTFYIVSFSGEGDYNVGTVTRGIMENTTRVWTTLAQTEPYLKSGLRDHRFNAIEVTPDGQSVIVNSGSRTDHGELGIGGREYPITSAYFKLPANGQDILLENDESALKPYLFADGLRNSFDMAFSPDGELFAVENSATRDDPEEMNWVREGHHYGFPWRLSFEDNPQQFPGYNPPESDPLLGDTNMEDIFYDDPTFPAKPDSVVFTDPITNVGPDADHFRDLDALVKDASDEGKTIGTFTPHSSPLGIVFDYDNVVASEFAGDCFVISFNDAILTKYAPFGDPGEDLLHVELTKIEAEERYDAKITRIVQGFKRPLDAVMVRNKIYVIEYGDGSLWEISLPLENTATNYESRGEPTGYSLFKNYPNPFNPSTQIEFDIPKQVYGSLKIYDIMGREVVSIMSELMASGYHKVIWNGRDESGQLLPSGIYIARLVTEEYSKSIKMALLR